MFEALRPSEGYFDIIPALAAAEASPAQSLCADTVFLPCFPVGTWVSSLRPNVS